MTLEAIYQLFFIMVVIIISCLVELCFRLYYCLLCLQSIISLFVIHFYKLTFKKARIQLNNCYCKNKMRHLV